MRTLLAFVAVVALFSAARAQPVETVPAQDQVMLGVGETKVLHFPVAFAAINLPTKDIAAVTPLSDQTLTVTGQQPGSTALLLQDSSGHTIYNAVVIVNPDAGHIVKIYGGESDPSRGGRDFTSHYCTETGCSRADKDIPQSATNGTVTIRRPLRGGGFIETTH